MVIGNPFADIGNALSTSGVDRAVACLHGFVGLFCCCHAQGDAGGGATDSNPAGYSENSGENSGGGSGGSGSTYNNFALGTSGGAGGGGAGGGIVVLASSDCVASASVRGGQVGNVNGGVHGPGGGGGGLHHYVQLARLSQRCFGRCSGFDTYHDSHPGSLRCRPRLRWFGFRR